MEEELHTSEKSLQEFLRSSVGSTGFWSFVAAIVGMLTFVPGAIFFLGVDELRDFGLGLLLGGSVLLLLSIILSPKEVALFLVGRRGRYGANAIVMTVAVFFILILANLLLFLHPTWGRKDVTATRIFTLSPQTIKVLDSLENPVRANAFLVPSTAAIDLERQQTEDLLNEFARRSGKFTYRFIDPELNRKKALDYEVIQYPSVVFEDLDRGTRQQIACADIPGLPGCLNFNEPEFVTGILIASGREQKKVYYLTGHKERSVTVDQTGRSDDDGFDRALTGLTRDNYIVRPLNLRQDDQVPEDAAALVIVRPQQDLDDNEARALADYIKGGGRIAALFDPGTPPSFIDLFKMWGVNIGTESLADAVSHVSENLLTPLVQRTNAQFVDAPGIEITQNLGVAFFPGATYITARVSPADMPPFLSFSAIALTTPASWLENDLEDVKFDADKDILGPFPVAMAVAATGTVDESERHPLAKFVIFGDSDFAKNLFFASDDNGDLFLNSVNWLAEDFELISIRPKVAQTRRLVVNTRERDFIKWTSWLFPPSVMVLLGVFVWWRRR